MKTGSAIPLWIIALLAAFCLVVLGWTTFGYTVPFEHETGQAVLDTYFSGYDVSAVFHMQALLDQNETASRILRAMYFGPELIFPALLTALLFLIFLRLGPIETWRGRQAPRLLSRITYILPFIYGFADYAENLSSLVAFGDSGAAGFAAQILPWMTKLKFASLAVCAILIVRGAILLRTRQD
ncbi:hypothetical protein FHX15_001549 [Rhizobium sp. BK650]|uniref:hypothetical protein n=1 Tax=Rhizobium sp. BK650 TaxID=2586990 RepID=UPI00161E22D3|nr:hypothetical protein [Rhizobium sp. BK650]MBB3656336.1 hypothetical protein [Rhizobium sp. BK650]